MKKFILLVLFILNADSSFAQQAYVCIANSSSGFKFDKSTKEWKSVELKPRGDKKLLKKDGSN